jgi:hypothetical protein
MSCIFLKTHHTLRPISEPLVFRLHVGVMPLIHLKRNLIDLYWSVGG